MYRENGITGDSQARIMQVGYMDGHQIHDLEAIYFGPILLYSTPSFVTEDFPKLHRHVEFVPQAAAIGVPAVGDGAAAVVLATTFSKPCLKSWALP